MKFEKKSLFNYIRKIIELLCAILSIGGIAYYLNMGNLQSNINSVLYLPLFFLYYRLYKNMEFKTKKSGFALILAIVTSIVLNLGSQLENKSDIDWTFFTFFKTIMLMIAIVPIYVKAIEYFEKISNKECEDVVIRKRTFFVVFGILFFFGLLGYLAMYPGLYGYDAGFEIMQIQYEDAKITTHFSVMYSYILYGFVKLGDVLFKNYSIGFAIYSFIQMSILTYITAKICIFSYKVSRRKIALVLSVIFFSIFPLHTLMMVSAAQDTLFCGILAIVIMNAYNLIYNVDGFCEKKTKLAKYIFVCLLLCMMRNNGVYILLVPLVLTIFMMKKFKIRAIACYIIVIAVFSIYKGPVFDMLNVYKRDTLKEMSSIPCQQIARSYTKNNKIYTDEDKEILDKAFANRKEDELFKNYSSVPAISDSVKNVIEVNYVKENKKTIAKLYIKKLILDPENYVEAFLMNSLGFWYPDKSYPDSRIYHPYIEFDMLDAKKWNERYIVINSKSLFPAYKDMLSYIIKDNKWSEIPVISLVFTCGTYFILLLFTTIYTIYIKKYKLLYPLGIIWGYYLTLLLSPVCIFRYCYGLVLVAPILISFMVKKEE